MTITNDAGSQCATTEAEALAWATRVFAELPVAALLGARPLRCDPRAGRMTVSFEARREFCNLMGSVQGGMLTAMLDLGMAFAVLCTMEDDRAAPTTLSATDHHGNAGVVAGGRR